MMKHLTASLSICLILCAATKVTMAQGDWVKVSPAGEQFTVLMPQSPTKQTQKNVYGDLKVDGHIYAAADGDISYSVWSFKNTSYSSARPLETNEYLDACADLVWESLLKPLRDELPEEPNIDARMSYVGELKDTALPGREYLIRLDRTEGVTNFYVAGERIYVLTVLNSTRVAPATERFLKSFAFDSGNLPIPALPDSAGRPESSAAPSPDNSANDSAGDKANLPKLDDSDPNRVFGPREVTQKARILERAEPMYTKSARKYLVKGTVIIRAVLSKDGQVTNIKVMRRLPHGLTQQAVAAAQRTKFIPAVRDGRNVSQYVQIEYNFNLY